MDRLKIGGIMQRVNLSSLMISSISREGDIGLIFRRLAQNRINIEFINQIPLKNDYRNVILCVDSKDMYFTLGLLEEIKPAIQAQEIFPLAKVGMLSIFPHRERPLIPGTIIQTLSAAHIPLLAMGSSISAICCVINEEKVPEALKLLSRKFGLS